MQSPVLEVVTAIHLNLHRFLWRQTTRVDLGDQLLPNAGRFEDMILTDRVTPMMRDEPTILRLYADKMYSTLCSRWWAYNSTTASVQGLACGMTCRCEETRAW